MTVALVAVALTVTLGPSSARSLPTRTYGPEGGQFRASFAAPPTSSEGVLVEEGDSLLKMHPLAIAYIASLGGNTREEIDVALYPHVPGATEVKRYLSWLGTPGVTLGTRHGLPAEGFDVACHEGDSPLTCPGQIADEWIVDGRVVYELHATQVAETEVRRFFSSFQPH